MNPALWKIYNILKIKNQSYEQLQITVHFYTEPSGLVQLKAQNELNTNWKFVLMLSVFYYMEGTKLVSINTSIKASSAKLW